MRMSSVRRRRRDERFVPAAGAAVECVPSRAIVPVAPTKTSQPLDEPGVDRYSTARNNLGNALRAKGRLAEAVAAFEEAIHRDPMNARAHNNLGLALQDQGHFNRAIGCYGEAVRIDPNYTRAYANLGDALIASGDIPGAVAAWREVLRLEPPPPGRRVGGQGHRPYRQGSRDRSGSRRRAYWTPDQARHGSRPSAFLWGTAPRGRSATLGHLPGDAALVLGDDTEALRSWQRAKRRRDAAVGACSEREGGGEARQVTCTHLYPRNQGTGRGSESGSIDVSPCPVKYTQKDSNLQPSVP